VDETGQLTSRGQQVMDNYNKQFNKGENSEQSNGDQDTMDQGMDQDQGANDAGSFNIPNDTNQS